MVGYKVLVTVLVVYLHDGEADWELLLSSTIMRVSYHISLAQDKNNIQRMISIFPIF